MSDNQSKITSFFKRPVRKETLLENEAREADGNSSDCTEIYDYESEISKHIAQLKTSNQKKRTKKSRKKYTLPSPKELNKILKNSLPKPMTGTNTPVNVKSRRSARLSSQHTDNQKGFMNLFKASSSSKAVNSSIDVTVRRSSRLTSQANASEILLDSNENSDPNRAPVQQVFAVKNRAAKQPTRKPEIITIRSEEKKNPRPREFEPPTIYSKLWCEVHSPVSGDNFADHSSVFKSVKSWLFSWNDKFNKINDDDNDIPNTKSLYIYGPNGVGKTSLVYSIAKECGYKIIEYNSSCQKLNASVLQKDLLESSQSHCIGMNKISNFFQVKNNNNLIPSNNSQSNNAGILKSLILFDDIDGILYEERSDLWKIIRQIIRDSRKPIIFTSLFDLTFLTSEVEVFQKLEMTSIHSQSIQHQLNNILKAEYNLSTVTSERAPLWRYVSLYCGDIRKAINEAQFWSKKKLIEKEAPCGREDIDISLHSTLIDLLSLEDCLEVSYNTMVRQIDDYICDYNLYNYHRRPSLSFYCDEKYASQQKHLLDCLYESAANVRNYDRYQNDLKHFSH